MVYTILQIIFCRDLRLMVFNCSYKTADETEKLLAKEVQAYVLTVETRNNGKESITAKEASLVYKPDGGAKKLIRKQDRYKWFLAFNQRKNIHWQRILLMKIRTS